MIKLKVIGKNVSMFLLKIFQHIVESILVFMLLKLIIENLKLKSRVQSVRMFSLEIFQHIVESILCCSKQET